MASTCPPAPHAVLRPGRCAAVGLRLPISLAGLTAALGAVLLPMLLATPVQAQQAGYGQTLGGPLEDNGRDFGTGAPRSGGNVLDATNPIDLMNRLRRATALDEATPPGDAVDAALRDFDSQTATPASGPVRSP